MTTIITQAQPRVVFRPKLIIIPADLFARSKDRLLKKIAVRLFAEARRDRKRALGNHDRWTKGAIVSREECRS